MGSATVQLVCEEYATRRRQFNKARLNWRVSNLKSPKRSLGWIPFKKGGAVYRTRDWEFLVVRACYELSADDLWRIPIIMQWTESPTPVT